MSGKSFSLHLLCKQEIISYFGLVWMCYYENDTDTLYISIWPLSDLKGDEADDNASAKVLATTLNITSFPGACSDDEALCVSSNVCIPSSWVCDQFPDCEDAEDEDNCTQGE